MCITRKVNINEYTIRNGRSNQRIIHIQRYIDTDKLYIWSRTRRKLPVQGIHKDNDPKGIIETIQ